MQNDTWRVTPLAQDYTAIFESPDPKTVFCYSPGLAIIDRTDAISDASSVSTVATTGIRGQGVNPGVSSGRIVATTDLGGPGVVGLVGSKTFYTTVGGSWQGKIFTSDDGGATWIHRHDFPFYHSRPFVAGKSVYVIGQAKDLMIIRSDDDGVSWTDPEKLTDGQQWHQAPANVHYANGCVYVVMERYTRECIKGWRVGDLAPVLMRGRIDTDLTTRDNWTFASELPFYDALPGAEHDGDIDYVAIPFYGSNHPEADFSVPGRPSHPSGWLETNVVQFVDPDHIWNDPTGRTFHLWMRAQTNGTGYACVAKVVEHGPEAGTGPMETMLETAPSGKRCLYVPCPGGQMKFHVLFDSITKLYWLLSSQAVDSMSRPETLGATRYGLPYNQRRRLQLHFSKNMVDWCFAGLVAVGPTENASRHYASMIIDGDHLHVSSRSGDERAKSAHDGNIITFHTIRDFRRLVY